MTTVTDKQEASTLNSSDRCDRCGAQAYIQIMLTSGFDLLMCAHHFTENETKIPADAVILDERSKIK